MGMQSAPKHNSQNGTLEIDYAKDRITIQDASNYPIAFFGKDDSGNVALKIAPDGVSALTASDSQLIFNSNQDTFKIAKIVTYNFSFTAGGYLAGTQYTIAHDLGYVPLMQGFALLTSAPGAIGNYPLPYIYIVTQTPTIPAAFLIGGIINVQGVDDNNIYVGVALGATGETIAGTLKFYVLQETAN